MKQIESPEEPKYESINLFDHYDGYELRSGGFLTVELHRIPLGIFSSVLHRTIVHYTSQMGHYGQTKFDFINLTILEGPPHNLADFSPAISKDFRISLLFKEAKCG